MADPGNTGGNKPGNGPSPTGQPSPSSAPAPAPAPNPAAPRPSEKHPKGRLIDPPLSARSTDRLSTLNLPPKARGSGRAIFLLIVAILAVGGYWLWRQGRLDPLFTAIDPYVAPVAEKMRPLIDKIEALIPGHQAPPAESDEARVQEIKELLVKLEFQPGPIDGTLDPATKAAIEAYQEAAGLPIDGQPSQALLEELRDVASQTPASN
jgi:hypothetical protein